MEDAIIFLKNPNEKIKTLSNKTELADIIQVVDKNTNFNPTLQSPNSVYELTFYQTRDTLDIENYKSFLDNAISGFRHSRFYKQYKEYLMELGLNKCQLLGISSDMATIEMHHNFLNIHDIAYMICEHVLNTVGKINTFQLIHLLKQEHRENRVPIVMLCKTGHQLYHNNKEFLLPSQMCFGFWAELLTKYNRGISLEIGNKILYYIQQSIDYKESNYIDIPDNDLLALRQSVAEWGSYNEYTKSLQTTRIINQSTSNNNIMYNVINNNSYDYFKYIPISNQ